MNIFISWSGERSRAVAESLRHWLPKIVNAFKPWLSASDIEKGARWSNRIASQLEDSGAGIICITPTNLHQDWLLFEAGALSKTMANMFVCPLLIGLQPSDLKGPLAQFQATTITKGDMLKLVQTLNRALGEFALAEAHVQEAFEVWWPKLELELRNIPLESASPRTSRPDRDILEEVLALVRLQNRPTEIHERPVPPLHESGLEPHIQAVIRSAADQKLKLIGDQVKHLSYEMGTTTIVVTIVSHSNRKLVFTLPKKTDERQIEEIVTAAVAKQIAKVASPEEASRSW